MTTPVPPQVDRTGAAQGRFEAAAHAAGINPEDVWVGGYAAYEWDHLRPALDAYGIEVGGYEVLEFGCNVGGSAVVLAALGATLSGVDSDPMMPPIARANLARHGLDGDIQLVAADGSLPFADQRFDFVLANSVLEYVEPALLDHVLAELHRVLRPEGQLFICGTASRIALRERHSGRWLVNYLPRAVGRDLQRGLGPGALAAALSGRFETAGQGSAWLAARVAIHGKASLAIRAYAALGRLTGVTPGWFSPFIELLARKI